MQGPPTHVFLLTLPDYDFDLMYFKQSSAQL